MPGVANDKPDWVELSLPAADLQAGDVIAEHQGLAVVVEDPLLVHEGLGLFDQLGFRVGAKILAADPALVGFRIWDTNERIIVTRPRARLGSTAS